MTDMIDSEFRCRLAQRRLAAIVAHRNALRAIQAQASADRDAGILDDSDLRDMRALDDAFDDLGYTLRNLEHAIADWEAAQAYGGSDDPAADRAWHRRRTL